MQMQSKDFVLVLRHELDRRLQKNPRYSLRSFAKFLEVDSSALSKILSRKRPLGMRSIRRFAEKIGLQQEILGQFLKDAIGEKEHEEVVLPLHQIRTVLAELPASEENFLWEVVPMGRQLFAQLATDAKDLGRLEIILSVRTVPINH